MGEQDRPLRDADRDGGAGRPLISVVLPVFNGADVISCQLDALAHQTMSYDWEVLVCDNGSTDGTVSIVQGYRGRLPHLRIVDASGRHGPSAARNRGAAEAAAPVIAFCDADDEAAPGWLAHMLGAFDDADIVCGGAELESLNPRSWRSLSGGPLAEIRKDFLPQLPAGGCCNMAVRRSLFDAVGGFDGTMPTAEDIDFAWRVQLHGGRFRFEPDAVMHLRSRRGLWRTWAQAVSYGRGDYRLKHKYAKVIDVYRSGGVGIGTPPRIVPGPPPQSHSVGARLHRFVEGRGRLHVVDRVWRLGLRYGERTGHVGSDWTQLEPPSPLP